MILCDTNILVEFYKNNTQIITQLQKIGLQNLAISAITQGELYFGAINKIELQTIKNSLNLLRIFELDTEISYQYIQLMEKYSLSHKLTIPDALIASTSLVNNLDLYTLNTKDFRFINGLNLYNSQK